MNATGSTSAGARWAPQWTVRVVPDEGVFLLSEAETVVLTQPLALPLAQLLDGSRDIDDVADALADHTDLANAYYLIEEMVAKGYVVEGATDWPSGLVTLAREWGLRAMPRQLPRIGVAALGREFADASAVAHALRLTGLDVTESQGAHDAGRLASDPQIGLLVVVTDDYLNPGLAAVDEGRRAVKLPWILARNTATFAWVGPHFDAVDGPCWHCLTHRLRGNRDVEEYLRQRLHLGTEPVRPQTCGPAVTSALTAGLVGTWTLRALLAPTTTAAQSEAFDPHSIQTIELATGATQSHPVVRRPQCAHCGHPNTDESGHRPIELVASGHPIANDSGYRSVTPEATLDRYRRHISPITGAVTQLTRLEVPDDENLFVFAAGHNFAMRGSDLRYLRAGLRNKSSGKGLTEAQARVSAMAEALERYQGLFTGEEPRRRTSLRELGTDGIHPNDVMLWSDRQFEQRDDWNHRDLKFAVVPEPFSPDTVCDFSPLWSLTHQRSKWLPTGMLYYAVPRPDNHMYFIACSNGAAAGNTLEEAVLQGMLELIERDAVAVWWYNRLARPEIDPSTFSDPQIDTMMETFRAMGRPIRLLDLTNDLGIPVAAAVSARDDAATEDILMGFGAHLDPRIAAIRAIAEVVQFYPAVAPHNADGSGSYDYDDDESQEWWRNATRASEPYLVPQPTAPRAPVAAGVGPVADMASAVAIVQERIESAGHEVLVLEQTRPDIGLPTVKVVAPGLRHFWARYGPGRLYDVPVKLGWLSSPTPEHDLNPRVMFL